MGGEAGVGSPSDAARRPSFGGAAIGSTSQSAQQRKPWRIPLGAGGKTWRRSVYHMRLPGKQKRLFRRGSFDYFADDFAGAGFVGRGDVDMGLACGIFEVHGDFVFLQEIG